MKPIYRPTDPDSVVYQDNEDATAEANRCSYQLGVPLDEVIRLAHAVPSLGEALINASRIEQRRLFDAFIYGVEYGRKNPTATGPAVQRFIRYKGLMIFEPDAQKLIFRAEELEKEVADLRRLAGVHREAGT